MRPLRLAAAATVAVIALGAGFYFGLSKPSPPESSARLLLSKAVFHDLEGTARNIGEWPQPRILNFWATWCAPCVAEMPLLDRFQQEQTRNGVQVLGIGIDSAPNIIKFREKLRIRFPLLVADGNTIAVLKELGNSAGALPFSVYLDREGRIVGTHLGPLDQPKLQKAAELIQRGDSG